jgi:hypothetical protein
VAQLSYPAGQNYTSGTPIPFNNNQRITGSAITQAANGVFTLSQPGSYLVSYNITTAGGSAPAIAINSSGGMSSTINLPAITGATNPGLWQQTAVLTVTNAPASFTIAPAGGDITLHNNSPQGTVSVVKVA